jgi:hypothetical protein
MLKYSLVENQLTERPDDYAAQAHAAASLDKEALINRMLQRGSLLTRTDIVAVLNGLEETVAEALAEGSTVNLPLFNTSFSISGVFDGPMDSFDGSRHKLNINLTKGSLLREAEKSVALEKTGSSTPLPQIQEVKDSLSGLLNQQLTPNGVVELRGYNLRIAGDDPACGLWFVPQAGAGEVQAVTLIENKPSKIIAMIPALTPGSYQVKVVTQFSGSSKPLKTPKTFVYPKSLMV